MKIRNAAMGTALVGAAFAVGRWSSHPEGRGVDGELFGELNRDRGPDVDRFFTGITELGSLYAAGAAAGALVATGRRRAATNAIAAAGATWLIGQGLKKLANRRRPYESNLEGSRLLIAPPQGSSWPSSHPAVLTTFTTVAGRDLGLGVVSRTGLTGLGLTIAASRVAVGAHYPSDVASGFLIGRAVARFWPGRR